MENLCKYHEDLQKALALFKGKVALEKRTYVIDYILQQPMRKCMNQRKRADKNDIESRFKNISLTILKEV